MDSILWIIWMLKHDTYKKWRWKFFGKISSWDLWNWNLKWMSKWSWHIEHVGVVARFLHFLLDHDVVVGFMMPVAMLKILNFLVRRRHRKVKELLDSDWSVNRKLIWCIWWAPNFMLIWLIWIGLRWW